MRNLKISSYVLCLSGVMAFTSCSNQNTDSKEVAEDQNEEQFENNDTEDDAEFAVEAADGGMLEVQLGKLAQTKGSSNEVKTFGEMMVTDHTKANEELMTLATQKNITLPSVLSEESQKTYNDLAEKTGSDFDDAYIDFMVKDHKDDVDAFKKQAEDGNDMDLKSWASGKVSTLEHHLEMAKQTESKVDSLKKM